MTENRILALALKATEFNDADKIVTLLTPDGKMTAILKGVKRDKAKLKYAAEPFCFGEYQFAGKCGMATVTGCEQQESFFALTKDLTKFYCGCSVLEIALHTAQEGQENPALFVTVLRALQQLCLDEVNPSFVLIKFVLSVFENQGQKLSFSKCEECSEPITEGVRFDFESGGLLCGGCASPSAFVLDPTVAAILRIISEFDFERLKTYKCSEGLIKNTLIFLGGLLQNHVHKIKSLKELIEL